jgi:hypothetical protein
VGPSTQSPPLGPSPSTSFRPHGRESALLPLGCGMVVKRFLPELAQRIAKPISN